MSLEYDPRAGNIQHFSKANLAGLSKYAITKKQTHTQNYHSNDSLHILKRLKVFPILPFFSCCFVIGLLPCPVADIRDSSGCPVSPLIFHQPIVLKLKAWGRSWRGRPSFYGSPLEPAWDCSWFPQIVFHLVRAQRCAALRRWGAGSHTVRGTCDNYRLERWIQWQIRVSLLFTFCV